MSSARSLSALGNRLAVSPATYSTAKPECKFSVLLLTSKAISPSHTELPFGSSDLGLNLSWLSPAAVEGWKTCTHLTQRRGEMLLSCCTALAVCTTGRMQTAIMFPLFDEVENMLFVLLFKSRARKQLFSRTCLSVKGDPDKPFFFFWTHNVSLAQVKRFLCPLLPLKAQGFKFFASQSKPTKPQCVRIQPAMLLLSSECGFISQTSLFLFQ